MHILIHIVGVFRSGRYPKTNSDQTTRPGPLCLFYLLEEKSSVSHLFSVSKINYHLSFTL